MQSKHKEHPERELDETVELPEEECPTAEEPEEIPAEPEQSEAELLKEQYDALQDQHLRLMAEYDNFRKRTQREKDGIYQDAVAAVLIKLLPAQDNFERAQGFDCASEEFAKGIELIGKSFSEVLTSFGAEAFGQVGEPFDPNLHHAVMHIEDEELGENVISQVLQKGYRMGDRVLRYAMVQTAN